MVSRVFSLGLPTLVLCALLGMLVGLGTYTFVYAQGGSYLSDNPEACINCHVMREHFDGWQKSPHHAVATCNDCHVPHDFVGKWLAKGEHGYRHSKAFTLQNFHEPIRITDADLGIVRANCVRCHEGLVEQINVNSAHAQGADCVHCHARVAHGPVR